jgi:hypothetical protein
LHVFQLVPLEGPYGIRTRAAAVRGRCPRPLDEWAGGGQGSAMRRAYPSSLRRPIRARACRGGSRSRGESLRRSRERCRSALDVAGASRSGRCRLARRGSARRPRPRPEIADGRASAALTPWRDTYQKDARNESDHPVTDRTLRDLRKRPRRHVRACSSRGSSRARSTPSTCGPRSPGTEPSVHARKAGGRASPSGRDRGTARFAQSSGVSTRTRRRRPHRGSRRGTRRRSPPSGMLLGVDDSAGPESPVGAARSAHRLGQADGVRAQASSARQHAWPWSGEARDAGRRSRPWSAVDGRAAARDEDALRARWATCALRPNLRTAYGPLSLPQRPVRARAARRDQRMSLSEPRTS